MNRVPTIAWRSEGLKYSMRQYHVYIMASRTLTLYTGVTGHLQHRVRKHKLRIGNGFTAKYNVTRLVFTEAADDPMTAIKREKPIKGWTRNGRWS